MKKFKLSLLSLAVMAVIALSSCGGPSQKETEAKANEILNELNSSLDSVMDATEEVTTDEAVVDTTANEEATTDTTEEAPAE